MKKVPEVGKRYIFSNKDEVHIIGVVSGFDGVRVDLGKSHRMYIILHGWEFEEIEA